MKIAYDAKRLFCNHRGLGNYSRDLIRILSQYYPDNQYSLYTPKIKIDVPVNTQNTEVILPGGVYKFLPSALWRNNGITAELVKRREDIYHGLNQEFPVGIEKLNLKKLITFHDAIFVRYPELYDASYRKIFIAKNKRSCRIADRIIAISEQSRRDAIEFFDADPAKTVVVYQGCNNIFRIVANEDLRNKLRTKYKLPGDYLLYVGAIEPRKNIATIMHAMKNGAIDLPLVVIGRKTKYSEELEKLASTLALSNKIIFLHDVATNELPAIYQMALVFVYPSIFEGFGIPVLEALCSNTPVITSRGGCFEETGGPLSVYVDPADAAEMSDALVRVAADSDLRSKMIQEGFMHATKFTDDKIAANMMQVYRS